MAQSQLKQEQKWAGLSPALGRLVNKANRLARKTGMTFSQAKQAVHGRYDAECNAIKDELNRELVNDGSFDTIADAEAFERAGK